MLLNYLRIAFRHFRKNRLASAINIVSLTIGLTSCLLISMYIYHQLSYDDFQTKGDRIARVVMRYSFAGGKESNEGNYTSTKVAPTFKRTFPEVESAVRMAFFPRVVRYQDKLIDERTFMYADSSFFDIFSMPLLEGDPRTALSGPGKVVLTRTAVRKYFGDGDPVGKIMLVGPDSSKYEVTGIMADCPANSQIKFGLLASFSSMGKNQEDTYFNANYTTYLLLRSPAGIHTLQAKLPAFMANEMKGQGATIDFFLEPFRWIHLHSPYDGFEPNVPISYVYILMAVTALILLIASFTYINLSTARSMERAREVGVRKVMGAGQSGLFWQFIGESLLLCTMALVLSVILAVLLLPAFDGLTGTTLPYGSLLSLPVLGTAVLAALLVGVLAGAYPALILSRFLPVRVLKGVFRNSGSGAWLRKSLIVFQFSISVFLIVSTAVVQRQLFFIQHTQLGFDRDHILVLPLDLSMLPKRELFKSELSSNPNVLSVAVCSNTPVQIVSGFDYRSGAMPSGTDLAVFGVSVDEDFVKTVGLQLIAGSDLTKADIAAVQRDSNKVFQFILNESAARELGWTPEKAIGQRMFMDDSRPGFVKGVVKDFHFSSLRNPIRPVVISPMQYVRNWLVRVSGKDMPGTIAFLQAKWKELVPNRPFEYQFLDEEYERLYASEMRLGKVLNVFAGIAIALACLGLFGLSSYAAQQRVKEVGIRRVLGAGMRDIVVLLSADFLRLSGIALLIAFPVSWWAASRWLQDFAYRINVGVAVFVLAGFLTLVLTLLTVSIKAIAAARVSPAKNLRTE